MKRVDFHIPIVQVQRQDMFEKKTDKLNKMGSDLINSVCTVVTPKVNWDLYQIQQFTELYQMQQFTELYQMQQFKELYQMQQFKELYQMQQFTDLYQMQQFTEMYQMQQFTDLYH